MIDKKIHLLGIKEEGMKEKALFFYRGSKEDDEAFHLLVASKIPFDFLGSCWEETPRIDFGYLTFTGLREIKRFIETYSTKEN